MPNLPVSHTIQALQLADQLVQSVTRADGQWPDPADVASQAEYATYLRELSAVTSQWQAQTQLLVQLLSDHPQLMAPAPVVNLPQRQLDAQYRRCGLTEPWRAAQCYAYMHRGVVYTPARPSFRQLYRDVLSNVSTDFADAFIVRCLLARNTQGFAISHDPTTYNTAVFHYRGYYLNIQLAADTIRKHIATIYDMFGLAHSDFAVWVQ
jgi:hypothetical protein